MERVRVGVIGCGRISQLVHLPLLTERRDLFDVRAICDRDPVVLTSVHERYPTTTPHESVASMVEEPLDAVVVATSSDHTNEVVAAASAGMAVLVEKPLCFTRSQADRIQQAVGQSGTAVMVGYMRRFDPAVHDAARRLARHDAPVRLVRGDVWLADDPRVLTHRALVRPDSGGPGDLDTLLEVVSADPPEDLSGVPQRNAMFLLLTGVVHDLNLLRALLGAPVEVVQCTLWDDGWSGVVQLSFPGGILAVLSWAYLGRGAGRDELTFLSDDQRLSLDFPSAYLRDTPTIVRMTSSGAEGEAVDEHVIASYADRFRIEHEHLHRIVTTGCEPETSVADAVADLDLVRQIVAVGSVLPMNNGTEGAADVALR